MFIFLDVSQLSTLEFFDRKIGWFLDDLSLDDSRRINLDDFYHTFRQFIDDLWMAIIRISHCHKVSWPSFCFCSGSGSVPGEILWCEWSGMGFDSWVFMVVVDERWWDPIIMDMTDIPMVEWIHWHYYGRIRWTSRYGGMTVIWTTDSRSGLV